MPVSPGIRAPGLTLDLRICTDRYPGGFIAWIHLGTTAREEFCFSVLPTSVTITDLTSHDLPHSVSWEPANHSSGGAWGEGQDQGEGILGEGFAGKGQ